MNGLHVEDFSPKDTISEIAQHFAAFEAEVREDMAETHVDKADAWGSLSKSNERNLKGNSDD